MTAQLEVTAAYGARILVAASEALAVNTRRAFSIVHEAGHALALTACINLHVVLAFFACATRTAQDAAFHELVALLATAAHIEILVIALLPFTFSSGRAVQHITIVTRVALVLARAMLTMIVVIAAFLAAAVGDIHA